ncbi:MAG: PH domain-containing protein [Proteobacteria bacterium]|nr:PH domain-containing protein [Pseudomonadota bacterium]
MSQDHDDYAVEPIRGLPEALPAGEHILWQGAPQWWSLAKTVFHIRAVAFYFAVLMLWRGSVHWDQGMVASVLSALSLLPIALIGLGLLSLLAYLSARTSVYTITNKRVVMRIGMALPTAINIPFKLIGSGGLAEHADGTGDIPLSLTGDDRMAYSNFWPHVRPWRFTRPEPMLRGVPHARRVAEILSQALVAALPSGAVRVSSAESPKPGNALHPDMAHANAA